MVNCFKLYEIDGKRWFIEAQHHYTKLSESKEVYLNSESTPDQKDDSILLGIGDSEKQLLFTCGVEEIERFAITLLNLCHDIKY
ncbi:hypothetical protein D1B33_15265 [Lysinibacillus yapensis]|uniref:Uncharacterized protein n=1 Tax=Ureibacillus yapensis TaxID=2304605 RepID=A0A396SBN4_9BACL|nr:hypothetical protein [Lysinibacillus yapensis]RHW33405.1 hypothetical protein D1B33_15265 [Lysinibacillus yapensis]